MKIEAQYPIEVQFDQEDQLYIASAPRLEGCMAHGKTPDAAVRNIRDAIELWVETALKEGEELPSL